ncbi:MAG: hypothetical protein KGJ86_02330, partial [Chloroflexota bacterium]|nr:hypothetical protein [Chloroflexota bacterium]
MFSGDTLRGSGSRGLENHKRGLGRREFLRLSGGTALAAAVGLPALLAACGAAGGTGPSGAAANPTGGGPKLP